MWSFVADEDEPPELDDFGFWNDPEYVWETCSIFVGSNFQVMPEPGGWDNQFADWRDDCMTWLALRRRALWEKRQMEDERDGKEKSQRFVERLPFEDEMPEQDWRSMLRE
jgi:hypothetical protein